MKLRGKIITIFWLTLGWTALAFFQYFDRYSILVTQGCLDDPYPHSVYIQSLLVSVILGGLFAGSALVFLWEKWLRRMAFLKALSFIFMWYVGLYVLITYVAIVLFANSDPAQLIQDNAFALTYRTMLDPNNLPNFLFWLVIMLLSLFFLLVRDNFGPDRFIEFLSGKYFRPRREERIFMFMDLKSSTQIAESLGEEMYFNFLNDAFKTATPAIVDTKGKIYQYVGDEMVISWSLKDGIEDDNCIRCFTQMTDLLITRSEYFEHKYGYQPIFKAGLHAGHVIAGEMGIVKREIVYTGDVLNTAARIQAKCNELNTLILISRHLVDLMGGNQFKPLGSYHLRGKSNEVEVFTLNDLD